MGGAFSSYLAVMPEQPSAAELAARIWGHLQDHLRAKTEPPAIEPRGVVTEQDACDALLLAAVAVERAMLVDDGRLAPGVSAHLLMMLMVARDHVRPLPAAGSPDLMTTRLREIVETIRLAQLKREFD